MVTNYYNSSNNFSSPIRREPKPFCPQKAAVNEPEIKDCPNKIAEKNMDSDTVLILGLIFLLILSGCEDTLLLVALGALIFL